MIMNCNVCGKPLDYQLIRTQSGPDVYLAEVNPCQCQKTYVGNEAQECWYLEDGIWEVGILYQWSTDYDDNGQYPVGIIEPAKGDQMVSIYVGDISFSRDEPEPIGVKETIAEITVRGDGHMRAYRLPDRPGKPEVIAVQLEPTALIIMLIDGVEAMLGRLTRAQIQGIAIFRDGEVECDVPDIDIDALEVIFNTAGCRTSRE